MLEVRRERILRTRALFAGHKNIAQVAKALPASKVFVRKAIRSEGLPDLRDNARATSLLERWVPELEARFVAGLRNASCDACNRRCNSGVSCANLGLKVRTNEFMIGYDFDVTNKKLEIQPTQRQSRQQ